MWLLPAWPVCAGHQPEEVQSPCIRCTHITWLGKACQVERSLPPTPQQQRSTYGRKLPTMLRHSPQNAQPLITH